MTKSTVPQEVQTLARKNEIHGMDPLRFTPVNDFTTFFAEYTTEERNIVVHFFISTEALEARTGQAPADAQQRDEWMMHFINKDMVLRRYWKEVLPAVLVQAAKEIFHAAPPRLTFDYTEELCSWWFKALGFNVLKPEELVNQFLARVDALLEAAGASAMVAPNATQRG